MGIYYIRIRPGIKYNEDIFLGIKYYEGNFSRYKSIMRAMCPGIRDNEGNLSWYRLK